MPATGRRLNNKQINYIVTIFLGLYVLVGMGVDLFAPILPALSAQLKLSVNGAQYLIAIYLIGYACASFFVGFLADIIGRRKIILTSLTIFFIVSIIPMLPNGPDTLLLCRLIQGICMGAYSVAARGVIANLLSEDRLLRTAPLISVCYGTGPILGPIIGAYLGFYLNWHACFYFVALFDLVALILLLKHLPETHTAISSLGLNAMFLNFKSIISNKYYMKIVIMMGFSYSILIAFNTIGPFIVQDELGLSMVNFGYLALFLGVVFFIGTLTCRSLIHWYPIEKMLNFTIVISTIIAVMSVLLTYLMPTNIFLVVFPSGLLFFAAAIIYPAGMAKGAVMFKEIASSASAVMNLVIFFITGAVSWILGIIDTTTILPLNGCYLIFLILINLFFWINKK